MLISSITTFLLSERHVYTLKRKLRQTGKKESTLILQHRMNVRNPSYQVSQFLSSHHCAACWEKGQKGLGWALPVSLTVFLPSQLVHQVGLACAAEAHDSHHHNGLPDGRQDLRSFWINHQSPIDVLNEALWGWHVEL